ncbi:hypothetical protein KKA69_00525 [Patescibacteria group bacterium]|nr:hypothetical protein [Patescibacteria group bacterium]
MSSLRHLFLPHYKNNNKANLLKSYSILLVSLCFVFFQIFLSFFMMANPSVLGYSSNISPEKIIELTNLERAGLGFSSLKHNSLLSEAARQKAADMFAFNYWAHVSPSGRTPWSFFTDVGYKYQYAGENLARDFRDPDSVVRAWMNSPSHRENIANAKYNEIGVAVVDGTLQGMETTLVVQLFGTPYGASAPKTASQPKPAEKPAQQPVVAQEPVETNEVQEVPAQATKEVLSEDERSGFSPVTSPLDLTKAAVIFIVGILIGAFMADLILVSHHQTPRLSSRSFAQMLFLIFVLAATFLIRQGAIL